VEKKWAPPSAPEAQRRLKDLDPVFDHVINMVWNVDLGGGPLTFGTPTRSVNVYHI